MRSGICVAAVLELPVPELLVRKESGLGRDLQLESEEFNAAFRVDGEHVPTQRRLRTAGGWWLSAVTFP